MLYLIVANGLLEEPEIRESLEYVQLKEKLKKLQEASLKISTVKSWFIGQTDKSETVIAMVMIRVLLKDSAWFVFRKKLFSADIRHRQFFDEWRIILLQLQL